MTLARQVLVYTHFIELFLTRNNTAGACAFVHRDASGVCSSTEVCNCSDPSCASVDQNSTEWLLLNLGGFSAVVPFQDFQTLNPRFSPVGSGAVLFLGFVLAPACFTSVSVQLEALTVLTPRQLAALAATPGLLTRTDQVEMVTNVIPSPLLPTFFDDFCSAVAVSVRLRKRPALLVRPRLTVWRPPFSRRARGARRPQW